MCRHKSFWRGTKCSQIFGLTQKIWTGTKHFATCKRTRHKSQAIKSEMIFGKIIQLCSSSNNVVQHPKQLPIVLMPSSYDLAAKNHPDEEGCVNIILVCGSLVLLGTISAIVALIFGLIWRNSEQIDDERLVHYLAHVIEQPIFRILNLKYLQRNFCLDFFDDSENTFWGFFEI